MRNVLWKYGICITCVRLYFPPTVARPGRSWLVEARSSRRGTTVRAQRAAGARSRPHNARSVARTQEAANKNLVITFGSGPIIQPGNILTFGVGIHRKVH